MAMSLSIGLMVADNRYDHLDWLRSSLSVLVYPLYVVASLPSRIEQSVTGRLADSEALRARNETLTDENLVLKARLQKLEALEAENRRLRDLLGSSFKLGERVLIGELLQVDLDPYRQQLLIDRGSSSGVYVGQPVLDADAVMGQVTRIDPLTCTVLLITDPAHALPVQVRRNGLRTVAAGTGLVNRLSLLYLPKNADIRVGDELVTSGLGGQFPKGYPVARVVEVLREPGLPFSSVYAEPHARLDRVSEVLLVWSLSGDELGGGAKPQGEAE